MSDNEVLEKIYSRYRDNIFINNPKDSGSKCVVNIVYNQSFNQIKPLLSIIMPIYNQEDIVINNINSVFKYTSDMYYEIIIILDACSDNTKNNLLSLMKKFNPPSFLVKIIIIESYIPMFETQSDNLGFYLSDSKYVLEIQADMEMTEYGYNNKLLKPFLTNPNIIGISGRCCHGLRDPEECVGKCGMNIEKDLLNNIDRNAYYIAETCNRGPLLLDNYKLKELGYLDEVNYFLDDSDHDLFARAYYYKKWICGYSPIEFKTSLKNGSTRKSRDAINSKYLNLKSRLTNGGINGFLKKYKEMNLPYRPIVKYNFNDSS